VPDGPSWVKGRWWLQRDLADVANIAEFAASHMVSAMTLEVNW
jgi:hypothetical protein